MSYRDDRDDEDTGAPAGCALLAAIVIMCAGILYVFAQTGGNW